MWRLLRPSPPLIAVAATGLCAYGWLAFQKGLFDPSTIVPLAPVVLMFVLEILKRRDSRSDKDRDREAALDERMQKMYEREITGLEKRLADAERRNTELEAELKEVVADRDRMRGKVRATPPSARKSGGG